MDDRRIGRVLRALRHRADLRQEDVAGRAGLSQDAVSLAERGRTDRMPLRRLRAIAHAVDGELVVTVRWRGGDLDRLLDEGHAALVGRIAGWLERLAWEVRPEVTFSIYGERGSIDLLAWHAARRVLLVIEVKTELTSVEETLRRHDVKLRLATQIARDRFGWQASHVARLLVLPNATTARRRVGRHEAVLGRAYPLRSGELRRWLREPGGWSGAASAPRHAARGTADARLGRPGAAGPVSGLAFVSLTPEVRSGRRSIARKRVRVPDSSVDPAAERSLRRPDAANTSRTRR